MILLEATVPEMILGIIKIEKLVELTLGGIITVICILGSAYFAYRYAVKKLKTETPVLLQRELYSKHINALQDLWALLQYTTDNENAKSVLRYEVPKGSKNTDDRIWYFNMTNGKQCREVISLLFYGKGAGLFIGNEIKELLFEYDRQLYGFLLREKANTNESVLIKNNKLANRMINIHENLAQQLKKELTDFPKSTK